MPFVLDASIAACWYFRDEQNARTDEILDVLTEQSALVPVQWWFEIRNVVLLGERRGRTSLRQTAEFFELLGSLPIRLQEVPDANRLMELARRYRLTFYDAAYLDLAQRERLPLATLDHELVRAAREEHISLL